MVAQKEKTVKAKKKQVVGKTPPGQKPQVVLIFAARRGVVVVDVVSAF